MGGLDETRPRHFACLGSKLAGESAAHFFFGEGVEAAVPFAEGEAATVFGFSCFGFLGSRPPFAIDAPPVDCLSIHACPGVNKPSGMCAVRGQGHRSGAVGCLVRRSVS